MIPPSLPPKLLGTLALPGTSAHHSNDSQAEAFFLQPLWVQDSLCSPLHRNPLELSAPQSPHTGPGCLNEGANDNLTLPVCGEGLGTEATEKLRADPRSTLGL